MQIALLKQCVTQTDWPGTINNNNTTLWQTALLKQCVTLRLEEVKMNSS